MIKLIEAPWTAVQSETLNRLQRRELYGHPYTCPHRGEVPHHDNGHDNGCLVATKDGWWCPGLRVHPELGPCVESGGHIHQGYDAVAVAAARNIATKRRVPMTSLSPRLTGPVELGCVSTGELG
jgi:hypothetical protein